MSQLLFWLFITPAAFLIAVLVLFREQLFDGKFTLWLNAFIGFFVELAEVYNHWHSWFAYEILEELEEQQQARLSYTPLLIDDSCPEEYEEPECYKL